jgi:hypothetical protein
MTLKIARGVFLLAALAIGALAMHTWSEPRPQILSGLSALNDCPVPSNARDKMQAQVQPDKDLLLVMFSLSQALRS